MFLRLGWGSANVTEETVDALWLFMRHLRRWFAKGCDLEGIEMVGAVMGRA
jgi:hypothetical protein